MADKPTRPRLNIPPALASAVAWAALDLYDAPRTGKAHMEARDALADAFIVINGAPLGFRGALNPDAPEYPGVGVDGVVVAACERYAAEIADDRADHHAAMEAARG